MNQSVLVAGVGYVGEALSDALHASGYHVSGITHSRESLLRLQAKPYPVQRADLSHELAVRDVIQSLPAPPDWIVHCASSGGGGAEAYREIYLNGCRHLKLAAPNACLLFTSSTSVYPQIGGEKVDEFSAAEPTTETAKLLRETEDYVLSHHGIVVRLAGIYGPGRSYLLKKYLERTATIEGDGERFINQVHRDDIVGAIKFIMSNTALPEPPVFNVVDSMPQTQHQVYAWLASHLQGEIPPSAPPNLNRKRAWTHKYVSNSRLLSLGWKPRYPSFQDAIEKDPALVPSIKALLSGGNTASH